MSKETKGTNISIGEKAGAAMQRHFGFLYTIMGMGLLLRRLRMDDRSTDNIRKAAQKGHLVYVLYARSRMDWLALNRTLNGRKLPLATFTPGLRSFWNRPLKDMIVQGWLAFKQIFSKNRDIEYMREAICKNEAVSIFLVHPRTLGTTASTALQSLMQLQSSLSRPIQLVPISVVWNRRPEVLRSEAIRVVLGSADEPGAFQKLYYVINRDHKPIIQAGEPVHLRDFLTRMSKDRPERQERALRLLLRRYLYRESHVIRGPRIRSHSWTKKLVMDSPSVKALIKEQMQEKRKSEEQIRASMDKILNSIMARFSFRMIVFMGALCRFIWSRIYSGIDVREEDLERIRQAVRMGTPILIPSHRSHLDYLLLSSICYDRGLVMPHIVAGENLSFWPLGTIFRKSGAFFIRRSFQGEAVFPVLFQAYLRLLVRDEFPIEFFIEGGRSRNGKLLPPKVGVLGMVVEASQSVRLNKDVSILPISISYEQIAEEKAYAKELSGKKKEKESVQGVLKSTRVLFKRLGKVYIRVGEPISMNQVHQKLEKPWKEHDERERREQLMRISERIIHRIGKSMLILPTGITALVLLGVGRKGIRILEVQEQATRLNELLERLGAVRADSLSHGGWVVIEALNRFLGEKCIQKIDDENGDIIKIEDDARVTLEYYKNSLIHFVAFVSIASSAFLCTTDRKQAEDFFLLQHYILRYEFFYDPDTAVDTLFNEACSALIQYGALNEDLSIASEDRAKELAGLTQNFLESYLLVLNATSSFRGREIEPKDLPNKIQDFGKARLAIGEVMRPEALSLINIKHAIRAFREDSVVQFRMDGSGLHFHDEALEHYRASLKDLIYLI
ncbi:MAG: hypothetical protein CL916_05815 [Deltaproteobacteria bacterium]|nr:hypothetical protein [Deltaproteobacteria bacterium]